MEVQKSSAAHEALKPLREPDGRVYFAGDYRTDMSSWMQGAFESAREIATAASSVARSLPDDQASSRATDVLRR